ncbi:MAG TPA: response regulator [bacterium]|nr:response regulator [bacterium]
MSRFLFVDDDPVILQICSAYFGAKGHNVTVARDGAEGFKKFSLTRYDLVVTDLMMPNKHGYQLIDAIKHSPTGEKTPVLLLTADKDEPELDKYARHHFQDDTLTKPFDMPILERKINDLLREFAERG